MGLKTTCPFFKQVFWFVIFVSEEEHPEFSFFLSDKTPQLLHFCVVTAFKSPQLSHL